MKSMNWKHFFAMILLAALLLTVIGCAKDAVETTEETTGEETTESPAEDYSPEVVDGLTQDFEEMGW
jgi:hypothetical protein